MPAPPKRLLVLPNRFEPVDCCGGALPPPSPENSEGCGAADDVAPPRPDDRPGNPEVVFVDAPPGALVEAPSPENRLVPVVLDAVGRLPNRGFGALVPGVPPKRLMAVVMSSGCAGVGGAAC